jgi:hypothetical protein
MVHLGVFVERILDMGYIWVSLGRQWWSSGQKYE